MTSVLITQPIVLGSLLALGLTLLPATPSRAQSITPAAPPLIKQGNQLRINGRPFPGLWTHWQNANTPNQQSVGISDAVMRQRLGFALNDSNDFRQQPVQWFSENPIPLKTRFSPRGGYRYLDVTALAQTLGWQVQPQGNVLNLSTPAAQVLSLKAGNQPWGRRLVFTLDRPAPWRITRLTNSRYGKADRGLTLTLDAVADPTLLKAFKVTPGNGVKSLKVTQAGRQMTLQGAIAGTMQPIVSMLTNPNRLVIDIRATPAKPRNILWAPGVQWREQVIGVGGRQFPVVWVAINPSQPGVNLKPIWGNSRALVGTQPLSTMAQLSQAAAAINGGFFNRTNRTPLGAIRRDGRWSSSPILNRGVAAWNPQGQMQMGRMMLRETLTTATGKTFTVVSRDSGYRRAGIALYTPTWGSNYTPLNKVETIITVANNQVVNQRPSQSARAFSIPPNGYLLVLRNFKTASASLVPGTQLNIQTTTVPAVFNPFPEVMGAGPLLLTNGRVVLNATAEQFKPPFGTQAASRSGIAQTAEGTVLLAAAHNRVGGPGPTLREWALILRQLGGVNALNLDGGSSTTLYLGGQLLDRHAVTAARVQNGIGVFVQPPN